MNLIMFKYHGRPPSPSLSPSLPDPLREGVNGRYSGVRGTHVGVVR